MQSKTAGGRDNVLSQVLHVSKYSVRDCIFPAYCVSLAFALESKSDCVFNAQIWEEKKKPQLNLGLQLEYVFHISQNV